MDDFFLVLCVCVCMCVCVCVCVCLQEYILCVCVIRESLYPHMCKYFRGFHITFIRLLSLNNLRELICH